MRAVSRCLRDFHGIDRHSSQGTTQVGFELWIYSRKHLADKPSEMDLNRRTVHLGELLIDADVAQIGAEKREADRGAVVERL